MVIMHVGPIGLMGHFGEIAGKNNVRPLFLLYGFSVLSEFSRKVLGLASLAFLD